MLCAPVRPVYLICASGEMEGALPGGLWNVWMQRASEYLSDDSAGAAGVTVDDLFQRAKEEYMAESSFLLVDKVRTGGGGGGGGGGGVASV